MQKRSECPASNQINMNVSIIDQREDTHPIAEREDWLTDLKYFEVEIRVAEINLGSLAMRYRGFADIMPTIEHFQNQFIVQRHNINDLKAQIRRFWTLADNLKLGDGAVGRKYLQKIESDLERFHQTFDELMDDFGTFSESCG